MTKEERSRRMSMLSKLRWAKIDKKGRRKFALQLVKIRNENRKVLSA